MAELIEQTIEIGGSPYGLPNPRTPLVGRDQELASLLARIADPGAPLVTITGPGGVGKTRLAVQAARESRDQFGGEVVFVSLADVTSLEWFVRRVSQSLRIPGLETSFSEVGLIDALADRTLLLLLDNLEQIQEASGLLARIMAACPAVKLLVTSRVAMHLRGEFEFPLAPLGLPREEAHRPATFEELAANPAVILFVERARAVDPAFALTETNATDIGRICARLDGLPLAIELAAARLKLLTPAALLSRLDSRLRLLGGGARDLPDRQQNLRQTIAWSYDLLESSERSAFRAVSV
ncbi:MAG: AAA family ATPase, partial [Thermomicrobiales bacterium]|nr:AAA family ATPase [Thermomicrobiales bacterium]